MLTKLIFLFFIFFTNTTFLTNIITFIFTLLLFTKIFGRFKKLFVKYFLLLALMYLSHFEDDFSATKNFLKHFNSNLIIEYNIFIYFILILYTLTF